MPLSPGVEALLRSLPRAEAGDAARGKMRLLAAYARDEGRRVSLVPGLAWVRLAIPASAAAAVVLGVGLAGRASPAGTRIEMVAHGSLDASLTSVGTFRAMRVVDDPSIPMASSSSGSPVAFAAPSGDILDGP